MKKQKKKPRNEVIEFIIKPKSKTVKFEYNFHSESIVIKDNSFFNAKMETSYIKNSSKEKRTNSTPLKSSDLSFNVNKALRRNFDLLIAVDTNTRLINEQIVSVAMSYYIEKPLNLYNDKIPFYPGASYIFLNPNNDISSEKLGWHTIISNNINLNVLDHYSIGLIVDCDLGLHDAINSRRIPYFEDNYLPNNMQLIYASSDSTSDSLQNLMISSCDKFANKIMHSDELNEIIASKKALKESEYCEGYSLISYYKERA